MSIFKGFFNVLYDLDTFVVERALSMFFSSSAMSEIGSGHQNSHFVESFKCAGGMPNILENEWGDHQRVARKWTAYLHDANRFFGVDSSATFNNKLLITLHASRKRFIIHIRCCQIFFFGLLYRFESFILFCNLYKFITSKPSNLFL